MSTGVSSLTRQSPPPSPGAAAHRAGAHPVGCCPFHHSAPAWVAASAAVVPPHSHASIRLAPAVCHSIRETMFGHLQNTQIDALPKQDVKASIQSAVKATEARQTAPPSSRLTQRVADLNKIDEFFGKNTDCEFLGFAGWGPDCVVPLPANAGMSQYHMVFYRKGGQVFAEEIGSSYTIFENVQCKTSLVGHDHDHSHSQCSSHGTCASKHNAESPLTSNGIKYDLTIPKTADMAIAWAVGLDDVVHKTMFKQEEGSPSSDFTPEWKERFTDPVSKKQNATFERFVDTHGFFHGLANPKKSSPMPVLEVPEPESVFLKPETVDTFLMLLEYKLWHLYRLQCVKESQRLQGVFEKIKGTAKPRLGIQ